MDSWHPTFLGLRHLPREVTGFEIEVFFQFSAEDGSRRCSSMGCRAPKRN